MNNAKYLSINCLPDVLSNEYKTIEAIKKMFSGFDVVITDKTEPAHADGLIVKNGILRAIFECKSCFSDVDSVKQFGYQLALKKAKDLFTITYLLKVPTYLILYVIKSNCYLIWRISELDKNSYTRYGFTLNKEVKMLPMSQSNSQLRQTEIVRLNYNEIRYFFENQNEYNRILSLKK